MPPEYDVYGVGNALVDVQHSVKPEVLDQLQIKKGLMTLIDEQRQREIARAVGDNPVKSASGGSAANTVIAVAGFGGHPYYACQVGDDSWGDFYLEDLSVAGVASSPTSRSSGPTGQCTILITPDADRTMNTFLGASSDFGASQIEEEVLEVSQCVYLEGYLLGSDTGFEACLLAQELARRHARSVSLTLSDPSMVEFCREKFETLVENGVDLLFCNEDEALTFTGAPDLRQACQKLGDRVESFCVTCGAEGATLSDRGRPIEVPAVPASAIDTTGAGDLFAGGVLFGITHAYSLDDAAKLGSYAASQVVAKYGPRLDSPLAVQIPQILSHFEKF